jgi:predicted AlkP superfamily phosphohydrolase/phosphomutase
VPAITGKKYANLVPEMDENKDKTPREMKDILTITDKTLFSDHGFGIHNGAFMLF